MSFEEWFTKEKCIEGFWTNILYTREEHLEIALGELEHVCYDEVLALLKEAWGYNNGDKR